MSGRWWALTAATGCGLPSGAWRVHEMDAPCAGLAADQGFLFRSPDRVQAEFPQLPAFETYAELTAALV